MNIQALTLKTCKNKTTEITLDIEDVLYVERLTGGNARLHFSGHDPVTVQEPYETVKAMKVPPEPLHISATVAEWNAKLDENRRTGSERRSTEPLENLPIEKRDGPDKGYPAHKQHKSKGDKA
jgi:hypothetical protein